MTRKLYDENSHLTQFTAQVLACIPQRDGFAVILDQTAFFPEGGGQPADIGAISGVRVTDVQETTAGILHFTPNPLTVGSTVAGKIDWETRFCRMQLHSGEHIVSGLIHRLYGYQNVGFHMSDSDATLDFNGALSSSDLDQIETLANRAVAQNLAITAEYPSPAALADLDYRSKLDLSENVRIVTIPGIDVCACCAPHVERTGEIGLIKILDWTRHRGGVRLRIACGLTALADYRIKSQNIAAISALLSAKQEETAQAVERLCQDVQDLKLSLAEFQDRYLAERVRALPETEGNLCLFETSSDAVGLRKLVNAALPKCGGICGAFGGNDKAGYRYVLGSQRVDLRAAAKAINVALHGKGGGTQEMIQGSCQATREDIQHYFET